MIVCVRELKLLHHICIAHTLNLIVKKAFDQHPVLAEVHVKARKLVGYFRNGSTTLVYSFPLFQFIIMILVCLFVLQLFNGLLTCMFKGEAYTSAASFVEGKNEAHARTGDKMEKHIFDAANMMSPS